MFEIDDNIPLVLPLPKKRGRPPGSKNKSKGLGLVCGSNDAHNWDGATLEHETCSRCGEIFPCKSDCTHVDCKEARGEKLPEWYLDNQRMAESPIPPAIDDTGSY